jgi:hypothetical protein
MKKEEMLEYIEENINILDCNNFKILWNNCFSEERLNTIEENQKSDLADLLLEEISYFEKNKIFKVYNFIEKKV